MHYSVYGLHLHTDRPLPGLQPVPPSGDPDTSIWLGSAPAWLAEAQATGRPWQRSPEDGQDGGRATGVWELVGGQFFHLRYSDGTEFVIARTGRQIWSRWSKESTLEDTAMYLLGPILGFVLRLRGRVAFHASAVVVGGKAVALVGPRGAGKSTTAAAFAGRGYAVVSEDVLPVVEERGEFQVQPGYPWVRLWPQAVQELLGTPDALPPLTPTWDKRGLDLRQEGYRFHPEPLSLAAIYLLGSRRADPGAPFLQAVSRGAAVVALAANTCANHLLDAEMRALELDLLCRLVRTVPLRRVTAHTDASRLPRLCDVIVDDVVGVEAGRLGAAA